MKLIIRNDKNANNFELSGVPDGIWKVFEEQCRVLFPENEAKDGETAVAKALASFITSVVDGETRTLLLTGIPSDSYSKFETANNEAGLTTYRLIAEMMTASSQGRFVITAPKNIDEITGQRIVVFMGFPDVIWGAWQKISDQMASLIPGTYPVILNMLEFLLSFPKVMKLSVNAHPTQSEASTFQYNIPVKKE